MARLRSFVAYRNLKRPYTRKSKYKKKSFVRASPHCKIVKFHVGNTSKEFTHQVDLVAGDSINIRDNALESARLIANRRLEKLLGKHAYHLKMRVYPHHIIREHALASGAGADRFSSGMAHSFGKPTGIAARVKINQVLMSVYLDKRHLKVGRNALAGSNQKLPCHCRIVEKARKIKG
ncbi:MAG: 50S ribosomal protein L16 [Nanoarchaeota archaeon]|nr:50S ribosomal protein L16 [Nanoarchaeota archaeon]